MKKNYFIYLILAAVVVGCFMFLIFNNLFTKESVKPINSYVDNKITSVKEATYSIDNQVITLINGVSEKTIDSNSASTQVTSYLGNEAVGDLNGDQKKDTAFLLTQNNGGSGTFYYLVAALTTDNGYQGLNGVLLGDRIKPVTVDIKNGQITVEYLDRKISDPMTAEPTVDVIKQFAVVNNQLVENTKNDGLVYKNNNYGFNFLLPLSWQGYSVITESWTGNLVDSTSTQEFKGPEILIRNPLWTTKTPYQDIPVMIFTPAQWDLVQQEKLSLGAAPIGPSELGRNAKFIFALPARYNFAFPAGFEEVQKIIDSKPLQAF